MKLSIEAPNLGQKMTFRFDADDDRVRADCVLAPGSSTPMHIHLRQRERFEITSGELDVWIEGKRQTVGPGGNAEFAPGEPHRFLNASSNDIEVSVEIWPALRVVEVFESLFALDRAGLLSAKGAPGPLRLGLLVREFGDELFLLAKVPVAVQLATGRALGAMAAAIGMELVPE